MLSIIALASSLLLSVLVAAQQPTTNFSSTDIQALLSGPQAISQTIRSTYRHVAEAIVRHPLTLFHRQLVYKRAHSLQRSLFRLYDGLGESM